MHTLQELLDMGGVYNSRNQTVTTTYGRNTRNVWAKCSHDKDEWKQVDCYTVYN